MIESCQEFADGVESAEDIDRFQILDLGPEGSLRQLSRHFPSLLSLCLSTLLLDASIGLAPHGIANDITDCMRSVLSSIVTPISVAVRILGPLILRVAGTFARSIFSVRAFGFTVFNAVSTWVAARVDGDCISEPRISLLVVTSPRPLFWV